MGWGFTWPRLLRLGLVFAGIAGAWMAAQSLQLLLSGWLSDAGSFDMLRQGEARNATLSVLLPIVIFAALIALLVKGVYFRRPIDRVLVVLGAYWAPILGPLIVAAALGVPLAFVSPTASGMLLYFVWIWTYWVGLIALGAFLPALPLLAYAKIKAIRKPHLYGLGGAFLGALGSLLYAAWLVWIVGVSENVAEGLFGLVVTGAVLGAIIGLIYWRIAGKNAGGPSQSVPPAAPEAAM